MTDSRQGEGHDTYRTCGARRRQEEGQCRRPAGWGTDHPGYGPCKLHAGSTPTVSRNAHIQRAEEQAAEALSRMRIEPVRNPIEALSMLAGEIVAVKDVFAGLVADLQDPTKPSGDVAAKLALYERGLDRAQKVLSEMARLNLDERLSRLTEVQASTIVWVLREALIASGADTEMLDRAKAAVPQLMRQVGSDNGAISPPWEAR